MSTEFRFAVNVLPKPGILDPQGRAVEGSLGHLGIAGYFMHIATLSWIAFAIGVVFGTAVLVAGILIGGRMLDRSGPVLLARLKAMKSA